MSDLGSMFKYNRSFKAQIKQKNFKTYDFYINRKKAVNKSKK